MDAVSFFCDGMSIEWLKFVIRGHQQTTRSISTISIESDTWLSDDGAPHNYKIHSNNIKEWWNKQIGFLSTFEWHHQTSILISTHCVRLFCVLIIGAVWMRTINYAFMISAARSHTATQSCHGWKCVNMGIELAAYQTIEYWTLDAASHTHAELIRWHTKDERGDDGSVSAFTG